MARPLGGLFDLHIPYEDALYMTAHRPCETRSAFRVTASLLAEFKLGRLGPKKSGRRDLNPRPPDPQSGALPSCATPRWSSNRTDGPVRVGGRGSLASGPVF